MGSICKNFGSGIIIPFLYPIRHKSFYHITFVLLCIVFRKVNWFVYQIVLEPGRHTYRVTGTAGQQGVYTMEQVKNSSDLSEIIDKG